MTALSKTYNTAGNEKDKLPLEGSMPVLVCDLIPQFAGWPSEHAFGFLLFEEAVCDDPEWDDHADAGV